MLYRKFLLLRVFVVLVIIASITASAYSHVSDALQGIKATTTIVITDFDDESDESIHNVSWDVKGSRYITRTDAKPYPQVSYPNEIPNIIPRTLRKENRDAMRVMGVRAAFNVKGDNAIDLIPTDAKTEGKVGVFTNEDGTPLQGVYFDGLITRMGLFALGIMRDYSVWAEFETYTGTQFSVKLGDLNHRGWGLLEAHIPVQYYVRKDDFLTSEYLLKLNKIVIRTAFNERVDDFIVYLDTIYYLEPSVSDDEYFDGYDLIRPGRADEFDWQSGSESDSQE